MSNAVQIFTAPDGQVQLSVSMCWRRRDFDPRADFGLTHHQGPPTRTQQRLQKHLTGSLRICSLGQFDVGVNSRWLMGDPEEMREHL